MNLKSISVRVGHSSVKVTADRYMHIFSNVHERDLAVIQATDVRKKASGHMWQRYSASLYQAFLVRTDPRVPNGSTPSGVTNVSWSVAPCQPALPYRALA